MSLILFQFYLRVIQRLAADLKLPFQLDSELFRKGETVVHEAIREALVNALIHSDYQGQGGIVIEKYPDRFEFSNPGSLLVSFEQLLHGGVSECRNKGLQKMFAMLGAGEKAGSGVDKIRSGWESQHWRSPIVKEQMQPDRVIWILPMVSLIPKESLERLKNKFTSKFPQFTQLEIQALVTADIEGYVDNARMRQITSYHTADITKLLQGLVSRGILLQDGQGRWTRYYLPSNHNNADAGFDSLHKEGHSLHKEGHSLHKEGHSLHKEGHSLHIDEISSEEWMKLEHLAISARQSKRLSRKEMEIIILRLCEEKWLTRKQISELVNRNTEAILTRFLTPMVEHRDLELRYPDKPNRIDQAYRTVQKPETLGVLAHGLAQ